MFISNKLTLSLPDADRAGRLSERDRSEEVGRALDRGRSCAVRQIEHARGPAPNVGKGHDGSAMYDTITAAGEFLAHGQIGFDPIARAAREANAHQSCQRGVFFDDHPLPARACKPVGVITRLLLVVPGRRSRAGSRDSDGGRRPRACRSARPCARRGRAAPSLCSSASAASCSCVWPRSR